METIEIFSKNKIAYLRSLEINEIGKKIHDNPDGRVFVSYVYPASAEIEDALLEYKMDEGLGRFVGEFKRVNSEIYSTVVEYSKNKGRMEDNDERVKLY